MPGFGERPGGGDVVIAHLSFSGKFYGRECAAFSLVRALQSKIDVLMLLVVETRLGEHENHLLIKRLQEFNIRHEVRYTSGRFSLATLRELRDVVREQGIRLVHCHCFKSAVYSILARALYGLPIKIVLTLHGLVLSKRFESLFFHLLNNLSVMLSDGIIGCSGNYLPGISAVPVFRRKTTVIANAFEPVEGTSSGSNPDFLGNLRSRLRDKVVIAFVGRLTKVKNPLMYLDVAARIVRDCPGYAGRLHFLMVGEGELRDAVERRIEERGLEHIVSVTGYVSDMTSVYGLIDILLLTSDSEGVPMCILESMSHAIPVVAPSVGGIPGILHDGETGFLYSKRNAEECVASLLKLVRSDSLKSRLGQNGRSLLREKFSYNGWAEKHLAIYTSLQPGIGLCR